MHVAGLSPRVWGSRHRDIDIKSNPGSIPTCVGQPALSGINWNRNRVYPHVCGAAASQPNSKLAFAGLSPRVWGSRGCST